MTQASPEVGRSAGPALWLVAGLWLVILFEPQWWLEGRGISAALSAPVVLFAALGATLALGLLFSKEYAKRWTWYAPLLCFIVVAAVTGPFALNPLRARISVQTIALFWLLVVGTVAIVDTARRSEQLLLVYALQFTVWGILGASTGLVSWHTTLANFDAFGAYVVMGGGLCGFLAMATENKWLRRILLLTVGLCVVGMVSSFARGAFLAAGALAVFVWIRSPRKLLALGVGIGCVIVMLGAASLLHGGAYWTEMKTILQGTSESTGEDRWEMWKTALRVFLQRPILGVGAENWGVFASEFFRPGEIGGNYADNPSMLYGRSTHNYYIQILAEHGIVGFAIFAWVFADFWRRNAAMRTAEVAQRWKDIGGRLRLPLVALGLEAAVIGWMGAAALYSMAGTHWLYTVLALNLLIHRLVMSHSPRPAGPARGRRSRNSAGRPTELTGAFPASHTVG